LLTKSEQENHPSDSGKPFFLSLSALVYFLNTVDQSLDIPQYFASKVDGKNEIDVYIYLLDGLGDETRC
jgi:hypothetical protein